MRRYQAGDGLVRYALTEPRDFAYWAVGRLSCLVLRRHNPVCDGRPGHPR